MVEAAPRSGSLITARCAAECGREVMAVPGSPLDPRAQGCNQLIREGATLVQSAEDVLEAIRPGRIRPFRQPDRDYGAPQVPVEADDEAREAVAALLNGTPVPVDEIVRQSGLAAGDRPDGAARAGAGGAAGAARGGQGEPGLSSPLR